VTLSTNNAQNWNSDFTFTGTNDLNLGTGAVAMGSSRTVTVSAGNLTVGGAISGSGFSLTKDGAGTLTLSGNNTYSGATTISAGTLQIASSGRLGGGSYAGAISNSDTFIYSGTNNQTLSGIISGIGSLTAERHWHAHALRSQYLHWHHYDQLWHAGYRSQYDDRRDCWDWRSFARNWLQAHYKLIQLLQLYRLDLRCRRSHQKR
jgi:autotransporter-associated beta strand protein